MRAEKVGRARARQQSKECQMIESLDIKRGARWTPGRLVYHMALATLNNTALPKPPKPKWARKMLHYIGWMYLLPSGAALAMIAALKLLMWGLR